MCGSPLAFLTGLRVPEFRFRRPDAALSAGGRDPVRGGNAEQASAQGSRGLQAEAGYGMTLFGDRFTGTPNPGFGMSDAAANGLLPALARALAKGETERLAGFGTFAAMDRPARTGAPDAVRASRRVRFRAGKALRHAVNPGRE